MSLVTSILGGFGLSAASGLNAYIPLLIVGLTARFTDWIKLSPPFDLLANEWVMGVVAVLLAVEFFADKIPLVDHVNDLIQTFVRPAAGAVSVLRIPAASERTFENDRAFARRAPPV